MLASAGRRAGCIQQVGGRLEDVWELVYDTGGRSWECPCTGLLSELFSTVVLLPSTCLLHLLKILQCCEVPDQHLYLMVSSWEASPELEEASGMEQGQPALAQVLHGPPRRLLCPSTHLSQLDIGGGRGSSVGHSGRHTGTNSWVFGGAVLCRVAWALSVWGCRAENLLGVLLQAPGLDSVISSRPHVHGPACEWPRGPGEKDVFPPPSAIFVLGHPGQPHVRTQVLCRLRPAPVP